jgi:hypothetical protein
LRRFTIKIIIAIACLANTIGAANDDVAHERVAGAVSAVGVGGRAIKFAGRGVAVDTLA